MLSDSQLMDFEWFCGMADELFKKYGSCYLAIRNEKILGRYDTFSDAVDDMKEKEPSGTYIIQECTDDPEGNTNTVMSVGLKVI